MSAWWLLPGAVLYVIGIALTMVAAARNSRSMVLCGVRMRYLALGLFFLLPGLGIIASQLLGGREPWGLIGGLVLIGMGALWLYARGGIGPNFPQA